MASLEGRVMLAAGLRAGGDPAPAARGIEPDDTGPGANPATIFPGRVEGGGSSGGPSFLVAEQPDKLGVDAFRLVAPASGVLTIRQEAVADRLPDGLLTVSVADGGFGSQMLAANGDSGDGTGDRQVRFAVREGRTYLVEASARGGATGPYRLAVDLAPGSLEDDFGNVPSDAHAITLDPVVPDGASEGPRIISGRGEQAGRIEFSSDQDVFRFAATRAGLVIARLLRPAGDGPALAGSIFEFLDSEGRPLRTAAGTTLVVPVEAGQSYYFRVRALDGSSGPYQIDLGTSDLPSIDDGFDFDLGLAIEDLIVGILLSLSSDLGPSLDLDPILASGRETDEVIRVDSTPLDSIRQAASYGARSATISAIGAPSPAGPARGGASRASFPSGRSRALGRLDARGDRLADGGDGLPSGRRPAALLNAALEEASNRGPGRPEVHPQDFYDMMLPPTLPAPRPVASAGGARPTQIGPGDDARPPEFDDRHGVPFLEARPGHAEPPPRPIVAPHGDRRAEARDGDDEEDRRPRAFAGALCAMGLGGLGRYCDRLGRWLDRRIPRRPGCGPRI